MAFDADDLGPNYGLALISYVLDPVLIAIDPDGRSAQFAPVQTSALKSTVGQSPRQTPRKAGHKACHDHLLPYDSHCRYQ